MPDYFPSPPSHQQNNKKRDLYVIRGKTYILLRHNVLHIILMSNSRQCCFFLNFVTYMTAKENRRTGRRKQTNEQTTQNKMSEEAHKLVHQRDPFYPAGT